MTDDYVCTLDEKSLKKAKDELNEDPKERLSAVETLRKWIQEQKHIKCPTDTRFLLAFLRARKFSQLESRALLEKYLAMKTKHKNWFNDIDPLEPGIQAVLSDGFVYKIPKTNAEGQTVLVGRYGQLKPWNGRYTKLDIIRTIMCFTYYTFFMDESTQVNGVSVLDDLSGTSLKHQTIFSLDDQKTFFGGWNRCIPARIKKILIYNLGAFGEFMVTLLRIMMPDQIQERLMMCGNNLENVYKQIPMECLAADYLPDDYNGPSCGSAKDLVDKYNAELSSPEARARIQFLSSSQFQVNDAKRIKDVPAASFRQLKID